MRELENDIKLQFPHLREQTNREIYFYNTALFDMYVDFIRAHRHFKKEIYLKPEDKKTVVRIVKRHTPTLKERGISRKDVMQRAKKVENDEFYTRYEDIEKEIPLYPPETWQGKCVFCNCDDAVGETRTQKDSSAFALYFIKNFIRLGLRKLICTHYSGQMDLFNAGAKGYVFTKDGVSEMTAAPKGYNGCFEDPLSLRILREEADIVCTNPPFSRAIDYWRTIIQSGKKFLIISNITNAINTAFIPYFKDRKAWAGYNSVNWFLSPKQEPVSAAGHWYTNIPIANRPKARLLKFVPLDEIPERYKKHDDIGTLIVDQGYIPTDAPKPFAVSARHILNGILERGYNIIQEKRYTPRINGKECFARVLIQRAPLSPTTKGTHP